MNWKNLKQNPPELDDVIICLKDPKLKNQGMKQFVIASYMQPDPREPELGAFIVIQTPNLNDSSIVNVCDLADRMLYIELEDIM